MAPGNTIETPRPRWQNIASEAQSPFVRQLYRQQCQNKKPDTMCRGFFVLLTTTNKRNRIILTSELCIRQIILEAFMCQHGVGNVSQHPKSGQKRSNHRRQTDSVLQCGRATKLYRSSRLAARKSAARSTSSGSRRREETARRGQLEKKLNPRVNPP